jgi:chromodomain-helicase-DNA-binding protein 7
MVHSNADSWFVLLCCVVVLFSSNTQELFTLLNFLEPDVFTNSEVFAHHFGNLQESEQVHQLQERIRPYVLRRMKESVEKSIPPKEETIVECELTTLQKKYYRAIYERNMSFLRTNTQQRGNMPKLLNIEMELRKCCNVRSESCRTRRRSCAPV